MIFEMATGDFLFEPKKSKTFDKDDDHLAQMMELLGRMPRSLATAGKHSRRFFDSSGHLRRIRGLNYWALSKVLQQKYKFKPKEAKAFADFFRGRKSTSLRLFLPVFTRPSFRLKMLEVRELRDCRRHALSIAQPAQSDHSSAQRNQRPSCSTCRFP